MLKQGWDSKGFLSIDDWLGGAIAGKFKDFESLDH